LSSLCSLLGYTRQAFYGYQQHHLRQHYEDELIIQQVLKHRILQPKTGARKLLLMLTGFAREHQFELGRDRFFDLLREHGLLIRKRKRKAQTTFSKHMFRKHKNLIREFVPLAPNQLWVSDITYITTSKGFSYLSLVTDAYSRKIMGFCLYPTLNAMGSINALIMALGNGSNLTNLIHHSDRGVQYCCCDYVKILTDKTVRISMTENSDPLENAIAERVNGILKDELLKEKYVDFKEAKSSVAAAILIYNSLRLHSSCDMLTPDIAHQRKGPLKRHWKSYYKKKEVPVSSLQ
jgi:putative transposase